VWELRTPTIVGTARLLGASQLGCIFAPEPTTNYPRYTLTLELLTTEV